jgi:GNAT superfamily N-acetyltransferase
MMEIPPPEGSRRPQEDGLEPDVRLSKDSDINVAGDRGEPATPTLYDLDNPEEKPARAIAPPDASVAQSDAEELAADAAPVPADTTHDATAEVPEPRAERAVAIETVARPAGQAAVPEAVQSPDDTNREAIPADPKEPSADPVQRSPDEVYVVAEEVGSGADDGAPDDDALADGASELAGRQEETPATDETREKPPTDVPGGSGGHDGPGDGDAQTAWPGEDAPWKRDPGTLSPGLRTSLELLKEGGLLAPSSTSYDDEIVVEYAPVEGVGGQVAGHVYDEPEGNRATIDSMSVAPELQGFGLSVPLVDAFARECEDRGITIIDGVIESAPELGALHSVFGENITLSDSCASDEDETITVTEGLARLNEHEQEEGFTALMEGRDEHATGYTLYFEARPSDRLSQGEPAPTYAVPEPRIEATIIDLGDIESQDGRTAVAVQLANKIAEGQDIDEMLTAIATHYPEATSDIANTVQVFLVETASLGEGVSEDALLWIKASLTNDVSFQGELQLIDATLRDRIGGTEHDWLRVEAAATWAEADNKTPARVREIIGQMKTVEEVLTADPNRALVHRFVEQHQRPNTLGSAAGYSVQPLTAEQVQSVASNSDGPKVTIMNNAYSVAMNGLESVEVLGSAPLGVVIHHEGIPQYIVGFDVQSTELGEVVTIRDIEPAAEFGKVELFNRQNEWTLKPDDIDFPALAVDLVPDLCIELGLVTDRDRAVLRVMSANSVKEVRGNGTSDEELRRRYDIPATGMVMEQDLQGNWVAPLDQLLR